MDTVTEDRMAIALAKQGGIGILHRFLSVAEQVEQVRRVKRAEAFIIDDPYRIAEDATVSQLLDKTREMGVHSMLVVNPQGKLRCVGPWLLRVEWVDAHVRAAASSRDVTCVLPRCNPTRGYASS